MNELNKNFWFGLIFQPLRFVTFLSVLPLFVPLDIPWETAMWFYYGFGLLLLASFVVELLFRSRLPIFNHSSPLKQELIKNSKALYPKFQQNFPLEFTSVTVFGLVSIFPNNELLYSWSFITLGITIIWQIITELHHEKLIPILKNIEMSEKTQIVMFVPITLFLVLFFIAIYNFIEYTFSVISKLQ